jgi:hypothetical protein
MPSAWQRRIGSKDRADGAWHRTEGAGAAGYGAFPPGGSTPPAWVCRVAVKERRLSVDATRLAMRARRFTSSGWRLTVEPFARADRGVTPGIGRARHGDDRLAVDVERLTPIRRG